LISFGPPVKNPFGIVTRFCDAGVNESHVIDEKQPHSSRISGAELEPRQRIVEAGKKNRFAQCATDVEKVMPKFHRPTNQRERVND
jgi:hypothetical protein